MVDITLPSVRRDPRPLRCLFLDLNAYFASCEQQERPELRGRPIIVAPMVTDGTVAIAASYEAKAYGIKTGTRVGDARRMCPEIEVVDARHRVYVAYHKQVLEAVDTVLPVDRVCSIDEMRFSLIGKEREPSEARKIALRMKEAILERVGECMRCSVGIAPNAFLAKLATEMEKPNGLVILTEDVIEERASQLKLTDFTGINRRMKARLNAAGIFSAADLYQATPEELRVAFGSITGERWWYLLRGYELPHEPDKPQKSLSHSHVLPPELRNEKDSHQVISRLVEKAGLRLRKEGLVASFVEARVSGKMGTKSAHTRFDPTNDGLALHRTVDELWPRISCREPHQVGVAFSDLHRAHEVTPSLFDDSVERVKLNEAVDSVNQRFGKHKVHIAALHKATDTADERIAFHKTELLSEGKGDNHIVIPKFGSL